MTYYPPTSEGFYFVKSFGRYQFVDKIDYSNLASKSIYIDDTRLDDKKHSIFLPSGEPILGYYITGEKMKRVLNKLINWKIGLGLIIFLAAFLRFWQLGSVPSGATNDEVTYIYNAYSIAITFKDVAGNFLPLSFNFFNSFSPLAIYVMSPFVGILGLSLFCSSLTICISWHSGSFLLFLIAKNITNNYYIALSAAFVLSVSPWHLQFSRVSYDGALALFFIYLEHTFFLRRKIKEILIGHYLLSS